MKKKHDETDSNEPEDFQPLGKAYPLEEDVIEGSQPTHKGEHIASYEHEDRDFAGRHASERPTGKFEVIENEVSGEGWTLPLQRGGGWEHPPEKALEETLDQIEEEEK